MKPVLFACCALLVLSAGCDSGTEPSELNDTVLTLQDAVLPASSGVTVLTPSTITLDSKGRINVTSCNSCQGTYAWDSNELVVTGLGCTEIACGERLDLGDWLVADRVVASDANDENLTLVAERDGELATFLFEVADP